MRQREECSLTDEEVYRLWKIVLKLKRRLDEDKPGCEAGPSICWFYWSVCSFYSLFSLMEHLKVGTLNVNRAREVKKQAMIYKVVTIKQIDVVFLQDSHSDNLNSTDWSRECEGQVLLSHCRTSSAGVGIFFTKSLPSFWKLNRRNRRWKEGSWS